MSHKKNYKEQYQYLELLKIKLEKEGKSLSVKDETRREALVMLLSDKHTVFWKTKEHITKGQIFKEWTAFVGNATYNCPCWNWERNYYTIPSLIEEAQKELFDKIEQLKEPTQVQKFVKDNDLKIGDYIKITRIDNVNTVARLGAGFSNFLNAIGVITDFRRFDIEISINGDKAYFPPESLQKVELTEFQKLVKKLGYKVGDRFKNEIGERGEIKEIGKDSFKFKFDNDSDSQLYMLFNWLNFDGFAPLTYTELQDEWLEKNKLEADSVVIYNNAKYNIVAYTPSNMYISNKYSNIKTVKYTELTPYVPQYRPFESVQELALQWGKPVNKKMYNTINSIRIDCGYEKIIRHNYDSYTFQEAFDQLEFINLATMGTTPFGVEV